MQNESFLPIAEDIRTIALINPQLAYMILNGGGLFPTQYKIKVSFETATVDQTLFGQLTERLYNPTWIKEVSYTVRRPQYAMGSLFKTQSDYFTTKQPYVDVRVQITGANRINVPTEFFVPLESLPLLAQKKLWTVPEDGNVLIDFNLKRQLSVADGLKETPYEVDVTLNCLEIIKGKVYMQAYQEARTWLVENGWLQPNPGQLAGPPGQK